jgi:hypothetical protein
MAGPKRSSSPFAREVGSDREAVAGGWGDTSA